VRNPILVVEDDPDSACILEAYLRKDGFEVIVAEDGVQGLMLFNKIKPGLVLLDMMLPKMGGAELLAAIRRVDDTPVIMVTAIGDEPEKLGALRYGADDYIVKPCNPKEVVARVHAVLRRYSASIVGRNILECDGVWVDLQSITAGVKFKDKESLILDLTRTEFMILASLMRVPQKAFTREELFELCLPESDALARVIDTHIHNLRKKLECLGVSDVLLTIRSVGYRFK